MGLGKENRAVVHREDCSFCRYGEGLHRKRGGMFNRWHGPFDAKQDAIAFAVSLGKRLILCSRCCLLRELGKRAKKFTNPNRIKI